MSSPLLTAAAARLAFSLPSTTGCLRRVEPREGTRRERRGDLIFLFPTFHPILSSAHPPWLGHRTAPTPPCGKKSAYVREPRGKSEKAAAAPRCAAQPSPKKIPRRRRRVGRSPSCLLTDLSTDLFHTRTTDRSPHLGDLEVAFLQPAGKKN